MEKVSKKIFNCEICEKSFTTNKCKKNHIGIVHGNVKKFTCNVCSSSFGFKFELTIHIENNHKGGKYCDLNAVPYAVLLQSIKYGNKPPCTFWIIV